MTPVVAATGCQSCWRPRAPGLTPLSSFALPPSFPPSLAPSLFRDVFTGQNKHTRGKNGSASKISSFWSSEQAPYTNHPPSSGKESRREGGGEKNRRKKTVSGGWKMVSVINTWLCMLFDHGLGSQYSPQIRTERTKI